MKYIIMILIIIGLALADYVTGFIKAYCNDDICSSKMRKGGLNKIGEIVVMVTACGLDIGIHELGKYYQAVELSDIRHCDGGFSFHLHHRHGDSQYI